jgi:hypothetical protein
VRSLKFDPAAFENLAWWIARDRKIALRPSCPTRSRSRDSASPSRSSTSQVLPTELLVGGRRRTLQALDRWPKVVLEHALDRRQDVGCYVVRACSPLLPVVDVRGRGQVGVDLLEKIHDGEQLADGSVEGSLRPGDRRAGGSCGMASGGGRRSAQPTRRWRARRHGVRRGHTFHQFPRSARGYVTLQFI